MENAFQKLLQLEKSYIVSDSADWNATTQRFDSVCGVETCGGNTGGREEGTVTSGRDTGNGANVTVPFIRGDINIRMQ